MKMHHQCELPVRPEPAHEELLIATAKELHCPFDFEHYVYDGPDTVRAPDWFVAAAFLKAKGIEMTPTLQVVKRQT